MPSNWLVWRFISLAHMAGITLFGMIMSAFLWYVHHIDQQERETELMRNADWAQQSLKLSLHELQAHLVRLAPLWFTSLAGSHPEPHPESPGKNQPASGHPPEDPANFLRAYPQTRYVALLTPDGQVRHVTASHDTSPGQGTEDSRLASGNDPLTLPSFQDMPATSPRRQALLTSTHAWLPLYSTPLMLPGGEVVSELYLPVVQGRRLVAVAVAGIGLDLLLEHTLPKNLRQRYRFGLESAEGNLLVSTSTSQHIDTRTSVRLPLDPPGNGLMLHAVVHGDERSSLAGILTRLGLVTLALSSLLSLVLLWRSAHGRLRAEGERDRLFLLSQDVFCVIRPDGTLVRGNPAFVDYFGKDLANTRFWDHIYPEDRLAVIEAFTTPLERIGPLECRVRFRNAWRWLSWSISVDSRSPESLYYAVAHDITGRKLVEQALTTEATFRRAIEDSISTGLRVIDQDGRITYVNRAMCQILGYPAEELVGQLPPYPYWIPSEYDLNIAHLNLTISGGAPPSGIQTRARRKDGRIIDVRLYVSPLIDDLGQQAGWMASVTDITESNRIRAELEDAHERFNTVINQLEAAVSVVSPPPPVVPVTGLDPLTLDDPAPVLRFCNYQYHALFGDDISGHLALLNGWPVADSWVGEEVYIPRVDRWFEVRVQQIRWVDGQAAQLVVATDITALRPIRERQKQQQEQLQQTARLVTMGEMASSIAHELNQPLAAISNYALGLAKRLRPDSLAPADPAMVEETLDKIARQAQRAASVIQRVRNFVRRNTAEQRDIAVDEILTEALALAEIAAKRYGVIITIDLDPGLPRLSADRILIEQVLLNLMKNAIDAMQGQRQAALTLHVSCSGDNVLFSVADHGPGIPENLQEQIFEPFFTTKAEGMGMGLNICRSIIESHAGHLWVEHNQPCGCVFKFTLPACWPAPESTGSR
ncbi:MAG: PAS domain S-box protein [Lautropia sp.]|nr:PAS domain S-box protein [Lautropia sp.]